MPLSSGIFSIPYACSLTFLKFLFYSLTVAPNEEVEVTSIINELQKVETKQDQLRWIDSLFTNATFKLFVSA